MRAAPALFGAAVLAAAIPLSTSSDFGAVGNLSATIAQLHFVATGASRLNGTNLLSGDASLKSQFGAPAILGGDLSVSSSPSLDESPVPIIPDAHDEIVLTVQTDCSTSLAHPSGPLPEAHPACDASHTVVAALESVDANAVLTPVPEADARALAGACAGALAVLRRGKRSSRPRAGTWIS